MLSLAISLVNIAGLALTFYGAAVAAKAVIITEDDAIQKAGQIGAAPYGVTIPSREEFLAQPAVKHLLVQSRRAAIGLRIVALGTGLQIVAAIACKSLLQSQTLRFRGT